MEFLQLGDELITRKIMEYLILFWFFGYMVLKLLFILAVPIFIWLMIRKLIHKYLPSIIKNKLRKFIIPFFVLFGLFCSLFYLKYDSEGYRYGVECSFCNKDMPYNLKPIFYFEYPQRFYLFDEDDFELVGIGFRYRKSSFEINDFLGYGYNDTSVLLKCADSLNNIKYLVSYETGYKSKKGNPEISFKDLNDNDFKQLKDKYQWVEIDEEKANTIRFMKFIFIVGALLSLFFIIRQFFKPRNTKAIQ